jgi:hypothetical protein
MAERATVHVPIDAHVVFFRKHESEPIATDLPFTVAEEGITMIVEREMRRAEELGPLTVYWVFEWEPRPDDPDDLAGWEDRRARGDRWRAARTARGHWRTRL